MACLARPDFLAERLPRGRGGHPEEFTWHDVGILASSPFRHDPLQYNSGRAGLTQQALADTIGIHVTQLRRYEAGTSQPTLDALRALARALACTIDSLAFDDNERGPATPGIRVQFDALDRLNPDEQDHVRAYIEGALLRHQVRQINVS